MADSVTDEVETAKKASFAQLLFRTARRVNERAIARMRQMPGGEGFRLAHTYVFPHLDHEGTRLTELARRMGISKQAVAQLVDELEAMGALVRVPDPSDGRAKLIQFRRDEKSHALLEGLAVLGDVERELREKVGDPRTDALHDALIALDAALDELDAKT